LRHAVVQAGGVTKRAELQWVLDVALHVAVPFTVASAIAGR
jgi:hypothetical protein